MEIGSKLNNARNNRRLTQEQVAEVLGVSRQTISNWENKKHITNQTYQEFLEESTNTVKAKRRLEKIILFSTYFLVWTIAMVIFWQAKGSMTFEGDVVLRWILLPLVLLVTTIFIAKNNYRGKGNWLSVPVAAITYLTVLYIRIIQESGYTMYTYRFPNFGYILIGIIVAVCGICAGSFWNKNKRNPQL